LKATHPHRRRARAQGALGIIVAVLGLLVVQFFRVQILQSNQYETRSEENRFRPVAVPSPRGTIFDRNGRVVADNIPGYSVYLLPAPTDSLRASLERIQPYLALSEERVERILSRVQRHRPLLVDVDADFEAISAVEERRRLFPGVYIEERPKRRYHSGNAISHVVGYVGEITSEELQTERFAGYEQGLLVGKTGLELQYERDLQGREGNRMLEVDAVGRIVGSPRGELDRAAVPGQDIELAIDLDLTEYIHSIFPDTLPGAVVVLDPKDGGVLALYSHPTFDPNTFIGGMESSEWNAIQTDPSKPMFNRTVMGLYPPASTWKVAVAGIALDLGVVGPEEFMPEPCTGGIYYGGEYRRCWDEDGHGALDMAGAIANSCNVYFYQLGMKIGLDPLLQAGTRIGFNERCGIDLPQESKGIFPTNRDFWVDPFGYRAQEGEVLSLAIGQGPNSQTPLKMAQFYLALARDGSAPAPFLRQGQPLAEGWSLDLSLNAIAEIRRGLAGVTAPGGTAYMSSLEHWNLIGKSGSGENAGDPERPHAWFAGIAGPWGGEPEVVVVALVEFGLGGSTAAAPIVAKAADYYLRRKHGIPLDTIQTLREHYNAGRPAPWAR
jgi:penicillin-binding protein 2